ncbi:potassium channel family protein [Arthrobacter sp. NPDC056886]|uniref:potassium channel family protein n=1 Tax=Arthrobacter sp. NPDC056886 TaxID=3345960 RepID=UPI00366D84F6
MRQDRWKSIVEWPLVGAALVFLAAYSVQVIGDPIGDAAATVDKVIGITWGAFVIDYLVMLVLARRRAKWFLMNIHELAILALPVLRPLRLLRLVTLIQVLHRTAGNALRGRIIAFVLGAAVLLTYCGALAVLDAEKIEPDANIVTFWDALWWALTTITTVGYGDHFPITATGRVVAGALMLSGIAVVGVVTAAVASWLVEHVTAGATAAVETQEEPMREEIRELSAQVERLSAQIESMAERSTSSGLSSAQST